MARTDTTQARLIASGRLESEFGQWFTRADLFDANLAKGVLSIFAKYGIEVERALKGNLQAEGKIASRSLIDSIRVEVYEVGGKVIFELFLEPHYQYVNDGRVGKKNRKSVDKKRLVDPIKRGPSLPPFEPISKWLRYKGIKQFSKSGLGFHTRQTSRVSDKLKKARLVDKIRYGIFNKGIEPTYFYKDVINSSLMKQINQDIEVSLGKSLELIITAK
jgi:hypothetical protein